MHTLSSRHYGHTWQGQQALLQRAHDLGLAPILGCAIIDIGESPATL